MTEIGNSADYQYYTFDSDNSILYHEVNNENFGDRESFIISISYLITLIERFKPKGIISKIFKEPDYFEMELKEFMQKTLYVVLLEAGTRKIAFCFFNEINISEFKKYEKDDSIKVRFFDDIELAKQWVLN